MLATSGRTSSCQSTSSTIQYAAVAEPPTPAKRSGLKISIIEYPSPRLATDEPVLRKIAIGLQQVNGAGMNGTCQSATLTVREKRGTMPVLVLAKAVPYLAERSTFLLDGFGRHTACLGQTRLGGYHQMRRHAPPGGVAAFQATPDLFCIWRDFDDQLAIQRRALLSERVHQLLPR